MRGKREKIEYVKVVWSDNVDKDTSIFKWGKNVGEHTQKHFKRYQKLFWWWSNIITVILRMKDAISE